MPMIGGEWADEAWRAQRRRGERGWMAEALFGDAAPSAVDAAASASAVAQAWREESAEPRPAAPLHRPRRPVPRRRRTPQLALL